MLLRSDGRISSEMHFNIRISFTCQIFIDFAESEYSFINHVCTRGLKVKKSDFCDLFYLINLDLNTFFTSKMLFAQQEN